MDIALRELSKRDALDAYRQGRITLREFAGVLNIGIWAAHDLLLAEGVAVAQGSATETSAALQTLLRASAGPKGPRPGGRGRRRPRGPA